ncbi:hypothetical protein [Corynebacterium mayonis]|uniref:hypothetical protein n=1 Tax=Corynebacterium mayonis TaxID=3062461 RepID=UPI0031402EA4
MANKFPNVIDIAPHMWVGPTSVAASTFSPFKAVANTATLKETHKTLKDPHEVNHAADHSNDYRDITEALHPKHNPTSMQENSSKTRKTLGANP